MTINNSVYTIFCLTVAFGYLTLAEKICQKDGLKDICPEPEVFMNASELITSKGYPCEEHTVETEDGYFIIMQRIPHGKKDTAHKDRPPIFLQHGLLCSSTNWITNLENESLAFILADAGYDVWLGNVRGNTYARHHKRWTPKDAEFWAFSWDQMAAYDLPAMVDHVLNKTAYSQLYYVGHSQGTLIAFAKLSTDPKFAQKIKMFFALGPVATVGHMTSPLKYLSYVTPEIQGLFWLLGIRDFLPNSAIFKILGNTVCKIADIKLVCEDVFFVIAGFDKQQLNSTRLPIYVSHTPAGTSVQNVVHFAQMVRSSNFQMYNYGSAAENRKHYKQATPPMYLAENVKVPVVLFVGENDWLADPTDADLLAKKLPNLYANYFIPEWDHLDFIWGMNAPEKVYGKIIKIARENPLQK